MSNLTQYKIFIGNDKKNSISGVTFSFKNGKVDSGAWRTLVSYFASNIYIFSKAANYFRQSTVNVGLHKTDIVGIILKSSMDSDVLTNHDLILSKAECKPDIHVRKGVLHDILSLHIRVRSVSGCILQLT